MLTVLLTRWVFKARSGDMGFRVGAWCLAFVLISSSACDSSTGWEGCPEERRCLHGDMITEDSKFCCSAGEQCLAVDSDLVDCVAAD